MKIIKQETYNVRFDDLSTGTCFEYNNKIYMAVSDMEREFYAVNLECGYLEEFDEDTKVAIIEIEAKYRYSQND